MPCLHAISSALEPDPWKRMGSRSWESFTDNPFFRPIDFEALERKELEPVFIPSSDKTNFDATYDLEELLLEEAPLEARARRQKPREQLKEDATDKEIREEELHRMIETMFEPFDYTTAAYDRSVPALRGPPILTLTSLSRYAEALDPATKQTGAPLEPISQTGSKSSIEDSTRAISVGHSPSPANNISSPSPSSAEGSPPIPPSIVPAQHLRGYRAPVNFSAHGTQPLSPYQPSYDRPQRPTGTRNQSMGGGMQVTLGETGSWSELAKQDATLPADAKDLNAKPNGMLGFLSRKKGRGSSPKPQERGILGKEGARVVISNH
jgi:serine/threonine kinase 32